MSYIVILVTVPCLLCLSQPQPFLCHWFCYFIANIALSFPPPILTRVERLKSSFCKAGDKKYNNAVYTEFLKCQIEILGREFHW